MDNNPLLITVGLLRLKDWYHYIFICSIYFFIFHGSLPVLYIISLIFLLSGIYMLNDFFDLKTDLVKPQRNYVLLSFRKNNQRLIRNIFITLLILSLAGLLFISVASFVIGCLIVLIMFLYSYPKIFFKSKPAIDLLAIFMTYALLVLTSFDNITRQSILLSSLMGLMAFDAHILQCIRDLEVDSKLNIETTVLCLGREKSFVLFRAMVILTSIYMGFLLYKIFNAYYFLVSLLLLPAVFSKEEDPEALWRHFKILSGITFCFIIIGLVG